MRSVVLQLPRDVAEDDARLLRAIRLFEEGRNSIGRTAKSAGYSRIACMEVMAQKGVASVNSPAQDLADNIRNA